jgi:hypothetical protein
MFNGTAYKTINSPQVNIETRKKKSMGQVKKQPVPL